MTSIAFMGAQCLYKCLTIYNIFLCPFFIFSIGRLFSTAVSLIDIVTSGCSMCLNN